ncbi:MAG: FmdE family protein [Treponemataceae bacterium]
MINEKELWDKCAAFHGHVCGGLTIGYKAALYAMKLLDLAFSEDEETVCVCENDACGVDAIQVILGCTVGKGNLLFHMSGKQAFSFYNRKNGKSVRLVLKRPPKKMTKEESFAYFQKCEPEDMFDAKPVKIRLPEQAQLFNSVICEECGEIAAEKYIFVQNGKQVCIDCRKKYDRFSV